MCNACEDPRDAVADVSRALGGLAILVSEARDANGVDLAPLLYMLSDRLEPAAMALQHYQPKP